MKKVILIVFLIILAIVGIIGYKYYSYIFSPNVTLSDNKAVIHIDSDSDLKDIVDTLQQNNFIKNNESFLWVANKMKFNTPKPGRYEITNNWSNKELVSHLRSGRQAPIKLTYNNVRTIEELCEIFGEQLEFKSEDYLNYILDPTFLKTHNQTKESVLSLFIPDTYEVYWNSSPEKLCNKLLKAYDRFWSSKRINALAKNNLTKEEAYTLASIVQKESNLKSEKPIIGGLYLNRIKKGMKLQADPTVIFGVGDFEIRRVLNKHLEYDSPYNTYLYEGIPPGPICMPDKSSIDAIVFPEDHDYLYFCVSPGTGFEHAFAKTLTQHNRNAQRYYKWLNSQKIYK